MINFFKNTTIVLIADYVVYDIIPWVNFLSVSSCVINCKLMANGKKGVWQSEVRVKS